ncbi:MAG: hypothetical protein ACLFVU_07820 [Phycisphaerae bacterium]
MSLWTSIRSLHEDESGAASIEWVLVLATFGIPMVFVVLTLLDALMAHYRLLTFLQTLPMP